MTKERSKRQEAIRAIVRNSSVRTQRDLVGALKAQGLDCTQATVSRDITEMGLRKLPEGTYALAEDLNLHQRVSELVVDVRRAEGLVIIVTQSGSAFEVCTAIDNADLPEVLGTISGVDTIFVATPSTADAIRFEDHIRRIWKA